MRNEDSLLAEDIRVEFGRKTELFRGALQKPIEFGQTDGREEKRIVAFSGPHRLLP